MPAMSGTPGGVPPPFIYFSMDLVREPASLGICKITRRQVINRLPLREQGVIPGSIQLVSHEIKLGPIELGLGASRALDHPAPSRFQPVDLAPRPARLAVEQVAAIVVHLREALSTFGAFSRGHVRLDRQVSGAVLNALRLFWETISPDEPVHAQGCSALEVNGATGGKSAAGHAPVVLDVHCFPGDGAGQVFNLFAEDLVVVLVGLGLS